MFNETKCSGECMDISKVLMKCELFSGLSDDAIGKIATVCEVSHYKTGITIISKGDTDHDLFIVPKGRVSLELDVSNYSVSERLDQAVENEVFGEMSLVHEFRRSANAIAMEDMDLLKITREDLMQVLDNDAQAGYKVMSNLSKILARRLFATNSQLKDSLVF